MIQYADERANLVAELKGNEEGKILAVSGHMDVVDAGNPDLWTYPHHMGQKSMMA